MNYMIVRQSDGLVVNSIVLNNPADYSAPAGHDLVAGDGGIGGTWDGANYIPVPVTPPTEEEAWASLRRERDAKLAATDWRITKEVEQTARDNLGLQIPLVWLDYRQALRDLPQNTTDPFNPVWPDDPV
jgi:hypothetical protein